MARPYTGKTITKTAEVKQKNGDIYVYERTYQYDRDKGKTVVRSNRLLGKKHPGSDTIVPTTRRRKPNSSVSQPDRVSLEPEKPGASYPLSQSNLCEHIKKWTCIGEALSLCCGKTSADEIFLDLWEAVRSDDLTAEADAASALEGKMEILEVLCRLRLRSCLTDYGPFVLIAEEAGAVPCSQTKWACLAISDGTSLGLLPLSGLLAPAAALRQKLDPKVPFGFVLVLDREVAQTSVLKGLLENAVPFVAPCPLLQDAPFSHTSIFTLEGAVAEGSTAFVSLDEKGVMSAVEGKTEFVVHQYFLLRQKEECLQDLFTQTQVLQKKLEKGILLTDLSLEAQDLMQRCLIDAKGSWAIDVSAVRREAERLSAQALLTNTRLDTEQVGRLWRSRKAFSQKVQGRTETEVCTEFLLELIEQETRNLLKRAAATGHRIVLERENSVSDDESVHCLAAASRLRNMPIPQVLASLDGEKSEVDEWTARLICSAIEETEKEDKRKNGSVPEH